MTIPTSWSTMVITCESPSLVVSLCKVSLLPHGPALIMHQVPLQSEIIGTIWATTLELPPKRFSLAGWCFWSRCSIGSHLIYRQKGQTQMEKKRHARLKSFLRLVDIFGDLALQSLRLPTDFWTPGTAREAFKGGTLGDVQSGGWPQKPNDPTAATGPRCHSIQSPQWKWEVL